MTNDHPRNLRDLALLAQQNNDGDSARKLATKAEAQGLVLSRTTMANIITGKYLSRPSSETVEALAYLAGVSREVAYEASGIPFPYAPLAEQLPPGADSLNAGQRRMIIDLAREFVQYNQQVDEMGRTIVALRKDDDATQAEDEAGSDPDVQGTRDRAPMTAQETQESIDAVPTQDLLGLAAHKKRDDR